MLYIAMPGWTNANISFMRSGGYSVSDSIKGLQQDTLVLWGKQDTIVESKYAERFAEDLPHARC
jgi:pimeloyl-ACP methyl ester carboxylesterase